MPCADFLEEITLARASNEASGTAVLTTLVDDAELVWRLSEHYDHEEIAVALGAEWSEGKVKHYSTLRQIAPEAWRIIVTTFQPRLDEEGDEDVTGRVTDVTSPFTENLLRNILDLQPPQQLELVTALAHDTIKKPKFGELARNYKALVW